MGLLNALAAGGAAAAGAGADYLLTNARNEKDAEIALNKAKAIEVFRGEQAELGKNRDFERAKSESKDRTQMKVDETTAVEAGKLAFTTDPKNVELAVKAKILESQLSEPERLRVAQAAKLAEAKVAVTLAADSAYIAATRTLADATASPAVRAQAALAAQQTALERIKVESATELNNARKALSAAKTPEDRAAAEQRIKDASYSSTDERAYLTSLSTMARAGQTNVINLETRLSAISGRKKAELDPDNIKSIDVEEKRVLSELVTARASANAFMDEYKSVAKIKGPADGSASGGTKPVRSLDEIAKGKPAAAKDTASGLIGSDPAAPAPPAPPAPATIDPLPAKASASSDADNLLERAKLKPQDDELLAELMTMYPPTRTNQRLTLGNSKAFTEKQQPEVAAILRMPISADRIAKIKQLLGK